MLVGPEEMDADVEAEIAARAAWGETIERWASSAPALVNTVDGDGVRYARSMAVDETDPQMQPGVEVDDRDASTFAPVRLSEVKGAVTLPEDEWTLYPSMLAWYATEVDPAFAPPS